MKKILFMLLLFSSNPIGQDLTIAQQNTSLLDSSIRAQTLNQLAQAEYYSKNKGGNDTNWVSIISVFVAGLISFVSAAFVSVMSLKNEKNKTIALQKKEHETQSRLSASDLISKTARGLQSITWISWIAKFTPHLFENRLAQEHDLNMLKLYPEIVSAQVNLAAHSEVLYRNTIDIVNTLYQLDGDLGGITADLYDPAKRDQAIRKIGELWEGAYKYLEKIPSVFSARLEASISAKQNA